MFVYLSFLNKRACEMCSDPTAQYTEGFGTSRGQKRKGNCPWERVCVSFEALGDPLGSSADARGPLGSLGGLRPDHTCFTNFDKEKLRSHP